MPREPAESREGVSEVQRQSKGGVYAVSVDDPKSDKKLLVKTFEDLKVNVPILRDTDKTAAA